MRFTIYAGPTLSAALEGHENRSGRINEIAARYLETVARHTPEMSEGDWCVLCDVLNGTILDEQMVRMLWAEIEDAHRHDRIGEKWGTDALALSVELKALPFVELVAIAEVVERFWQHADLPTAEALAKAGARIKD